MPPYRLIHNRRHLIRNPNLEGLASWTDIRDETVILGEWQADAPARRERLKRIAEYLGGEIPVLRRAEEILAKEAYEADYIQFQEKRTFARKGWLRSKIQGPNVDRWVDIEKYDVESFRPSGPQLKVVN